MNALASLRNPHHELALSEHEVLTRLQDPTATFDVATIAWKGNTTFKEAPATHIGVSQIWRLFTPRREEVAQFGLLTPRVGDELQGERVLFARKHTVLGEEVTTFLRPSLLGLRPLPTGEWKHGVFAVKPDDLSSVLNLSPERLETYLSQVIQRLVRPCSEASRALTGR